MRLSVNNLHLNLGDFEIRIPSWHLPSRSHLVIEGPSGTGKTTFLHILAGLLPIERGEILLDAHQIHAMSAAQRTLFRRQHCGINFQKIHLIPHLNLEENILLGCKSTQDVRQLPNLVEQVGLSHRLKHRPAQLSLGETQRAAVVRALISQPTLILADEPTSGLDDSNAERVLRLLQQASKDRTLLLVSHDARVKKAFANTLDFREILK